MVYFVDTVFQESPHETIIMIQFLEMLTRNDFMLSAGSENKEAHSLYAVLPIKKHVFHITRNWNTQSWMAHIDMMFIPH